LILTNPEARRALRSIVQAVVALVVVGLVAWIIHKLDGNAGPLERIAMFLCCIVALGTLGYIAENVTRAIKFKIGAGGIEGGIGDDTIRDGDTVTMEKAE
jgi:hypothetical protein